MGAQATSISAELFDKQITDYSIDSRSVGAGELFFALSQPDYVRAGFNGEFVDGHTFIADAFAKGAIAAVARADRVSGDSELESLKDRLLLVDDAIAALQNAGFKTTTQRNPDSTIPPNRVIGTDPSAGTSVGAGDEVTLNVSTGPEQREVVDCKILTYADCVQKLTDAGFGKFKQSQSPSTPEMKDKVLATIPPANQTSAITNEITIVVGSGPESKPVPDVKGQTVGSAQQVLAASGFTKPVVVEVDSTSPKGQVVGTIPAANDIVPLDSVIQIQVSLGNQFVMPDVRGGFWTDVEPNLRNAYGWTGPLIRGPDVQNSGQRTNAVVTQSPAPGTAVKFGDPITLAFAS